MRVLVVSDQASDYLWGPGVTRALEGVELILSCGDLPAEYLEYLTTCTSAPLLYVPGNHDAGYVRRPPGGCESIDGRLVKVKGLRILGLGGSAKYNGESPYQYTQAEMARRVRRLWLPLRRQGGVDILLTHAPALGLGDGDDLAHTGFAAFRDLLDRWQPPYFIHGHSHLNYSARLKRISHYNKTQIVNAYGRYLFDISPAGLR